MNSETKDMTMDYTRLEELQCVYSDMYKDANGFRPRNVDPAVWNSEEALLSEINWLGSIIEREIEFERELEAKAKAEEARLAELTRDLTQVRPLRVSLFDMTRGA